MKKKLSALLAILLVYAMMVPMTMAYQADEDGYVNLPSTTSNISQTVVGRGSVIDPTAHAVWKIVFPTADAVSYYIDPQGIISKADIYAEENVDSSAVLLFNQLDEDGEEVEGLATKTGEIAVVNAGTVDVVVELNVRPTRTTMKYLSSAIEPSSDETKASIGFTVAGNSSAAGTAIPLVGWNSSATLKANLAAFSLEDGEFDEGTGEFNFRWDPEGEEDEAAGILFERASFYFEGVTNPKDGKTIWANEVAPNLEMTWTVRSTQTESIQIDISGLGSSAGYEVAADRLTAAPGDIVTLYMQPDSAHEDDVIAQVTDTPAKMTMSTCNYTLNKATPDITDGTEFTLGDPARIENGLWSISFRVPLKEGVQGFSSKMENDNANKVEFTDPFGFKKVTLSSEIASSSAVNP